MPTTEIFNEIHKIINDFQKSQLSLNGNKVNFKYWDIDHVGHANAFLQKKIFITCNSFTKLITIDVSWFQFDYYIYN